LTNGDKKYVKVGNEPPRGNLWGITHARLKPCPTEHVICRVDLKVCFYGTSHIPFGKWGEGLHFFPKEREMIEGQDFLNEIAARLRRSQRQAGQKKAVDIRALRIYRPPRPLFKAFPISLSTSFFFIASRLSKNFLPIASAISTFAFPFLKYIFVGMRV